MFRDFSKWRVPLFEKSRNASPGGIPREKEEMAQHNKPLLRLFIFLQERVAGILDSVLRILNTRNIVFSSPIFSVPPCL